MTSPEPFFVPLPQPRTSDEPGEAYFPDLPFQVPVNVVGVPVALRLGLAQTPDTLVVLSHAVAYDRGITLVVDTWVRPGTELSETDYTWEAQRPRFGVLLENGTKVGHDPNRQWGVSPDEAELGDEQAGPADGVVAPGIVQVNGSADTLTTSTTWWLYPFPAGLSLELVVAWQTRGVPETFTHLPLAEIQAAAVLAEPLWPLPAPPDGGYVGWASYGSPLGGEPPRPDWYLGSTDPSDPGRAEP